MIHPCYAVSDRTRDWPTGDVVTMRGLRLQPEVLWNDTASGACTSEDLLWCAEAAALADRQCMQCAAHIQLTATSTESHTPKAYHASTSRSDDPLDKTRPHQCLKLYIAPRTNRHLCRDQRRALQPHPLWYLAFNHPSLLLLIPWSVLPGPLVAQSQV